MTVAVSKAAEDGAEAVICASTGNTAASAAAYAARAGIPAVVLTPEGAVAGAKVAQTRMLGAKVLEVRGDFDEALAAAQELAAAARTSSSTPSTRTAAKARRPRCSRSSRSSAARPDAFVIPYGGGGNTSAYATGDRRARARDADLLGRGASTARRRSPRRSGSATPSTPTSVRASGANVVTVSDEEIVAAWLELATVEGLFCEPSSAAGLAAIRRGDGARRAARRHDHRPRPEGHRERRPLRAGARAGRRRPRRDRRRGPETLTR